MLIVKPSILMKMILNPKLIPIAENIKKFTLVMNAIQDK
jgi:hypothetical protein